MFLSIRQIEESLEKLKSIHPFYGIIFLVCKKEALPIDLSIPFPMSLKETEFLDEFYRPEGTSEYFYRVTRVSEKKKHWVPRKKYASSTLQSIRTQSVFQKAFLHDPNSDKWGWHLDYIQVLKKNLSKNSSPFRNAPIPAFNLAVWLYRNRHWPPRTKPEDIINTFLSEFLINPEERKHLFDLTIPMTLYSESYFQEQPVLWKDLRGIIGSPPDSKSEEGAALRFLEMVEVGPATKFRYEPADRLNIITGDNSLGKTFILESIWWALTGEDLEYPLVPRKEAAQKKPRITFSLSTTNGGSQDFSTGYDWVKQSWKTPSKREALSGLVIYARIDGSFAVWDPARTFMIEQDVQTRKLPVHLFFRRKDIWSGLSIRDAYQQEHWLCNGLIRDWVSWQEGGDRYKQHYESLMACLNILSPSGEPLALSKPTRISIEDSRDFPTLRMPYGDVSIVHASAGVQRIAALAYIMVWAWHEHLANSSIIRRKPQRRLVMLVDEVEGHLHPRWQRTIIPSLMGVVSQLESSISPQLHIATHSPMVMASAETIFNEETDDLHHLRLVGSEVVLEELKFIRRGRADLWLMSNVFGLGEPRSLPAEQAINDARILQLDEKPEADAVKEVNSRLIKYLAPDDDFWPHWRFFAKQFGIK